MKFTNEVKGNIMRAAWAYSRQQATKFGGKPSEYFALSLKLYWDAAKRQVAKAKAAEARKNVIQLKDWFLSKNFALKSDLEVAEKTNIAKETEKALQVEVIVNNQVVGTYWVPKSVVA